MVEMNKNLSRGIMALMMATSLSGCGMWSRLQQVGQEPPLTPIENPVEAKGYEPISMPMPKVNEAKGGVNSLWSPGAKGFFKDQRASKVGDIITVKVSAKDNALMENEMEQNRDDNSDSMGIGALFGYESYLDKAFPGAVDNTNLINIDSNREISGDGKIDRQENIEMTMAAVVTQVLPNGNLVIEGTQEIRVSYEVRQLTVKGIIRRADITSDNTIESSKIAELRVSYGGQGVITDVQQPRYGRQILDIVAPF